MASGHMQEYSFQVSGDSEALVAHMRFETTAYSF